MNRSKKNMKPQDVVVLLKIIALGDQPWYHHTLAQSLGISQSEVTESLNRSRFSGLINAERKQVSRLSLLDFIRYGIKYAFPEQPGAVVRGVPTAHAALPLSKEIQSQEAFVWPDSAGKVRGQAIEPLYRSVPQAVQEDPQLYALLALVDAFRVGRVREQQLAVQHLQQIFHHG